LTDPFLWTKPATPPTGLSEEEFASLPDTLTVRVVKIQFAAKGFRTTSCLIATTLLDAQLYTLESLGERGQSKIRDTFLYTQR